MREPSNGFIYLLPASDGKIASIGVGNAMEIFYNNTGTVKTDEFIMDTKACLAAFENIKAGDSQEKILTQYAEKFGYKYTEFKTYTSEGEKEYYRFVCDRNYINYEDATKVPLYVELYFENGVLTDGKINYLIKSGFSLTPQERQNAAPGAVCAPQFGQKLLPAFFGAPQFTQTAATSSIGFPQFLQYICIPPTKSKVYVLFAVCE